MTLPCHQVREPSRGGLLFLLPSEVLPTLLVPVVLVVLVSETVAMVLVVVLCSITPNPLTFRPLPT